MPLSSPINTVVFDFDGTLVLSNAIKRQAFFDTATDVGIDHALVTRVLADMPQGNRHTLFAEIAQRATDDGADRDLDGPTLVDRYAEICACEIAVCDWVPGALPALDALAGAGFTLAINSATPTEALLPAVASRHISERFVAVLGGPEDKMTNLQTIADQQQITALQMVMVGDGRDDYLAAERFGCAFVAIVLADERHGRPVHGMPDTPRWQLPDLAGLPEMIERLSAQAR